MNRSRKTCLCLISLAFASLAQAADEPSTGLAEGAPPRPVRIEAAPSPWRLGIALGYGERSNPLIGSSEIPVAVDLDIAWFGERFFFDNGDLGYTFVNNDALTLSLIGRVNSDRVFFSKANTRLVTFDVGLAGPVDVELEPPDRDFAIELGAELLTDGGWGQLQLTAFGDVSGTHEGFELAARWSRGFRWQRLSIEPSIGVIYKSAELNNHYFGLRADETASSGLEVRLDDGINVGARLAVSYQITPSWAASGVFEVERLNSDVRASPIVAEGTVTGYFAGLSYRF